MIISSGPEAIRDPEKIDDREDYQVDFIGSALVVKNIYHPEYQFVQSYHGNHAFKVTPGQNNSYEFLLASAWSEGAVYNNKKDFTDYIRKSEQEFNNPLQVQFAGTDEK